MEVEGGERKEEGSVPLPANYVSLAQLQERWLRKQEEKKLKEEESKLKEEEDKRERAARAHQNENERGFVRATGVVLVQDKGKGKEIVGGGPGDINKPKFINKRNDTRKLKRAAMAEVLGGGGTPILSGSSGGVEEIESVYAVQVLPINGERQIITQMNKTGFRKNGIYDKGSSRVNELRQREMALASEKEKEKEKEGCETNRGLKWKDKGRDTGEERGRNGGRVNELKQSEMALDLKKQGENGPGMKWRGRGRETGGERGRGRDRGGVNELKQSDVALDLEKEKKEKEEGGENDHGMKWKERGRYRGEGSGMNGDRVNELKQSEVALNLEKDKEKKEGENDRGMKLEERGRYRGEEGGRNVGRVNELKQSEVALNLEEGENDRGMKLKERGRNGGTVSELKQIKVAIDLKKEKEEEEEEEEEEKGENDRGMKWKERGKWRDRGEERGRNGWNLERKINRKKEYRPVGVLTGNEVNSKLENKAEDRISEVCSQISSLNVGDKNGIRGRDNKARADGGVEGPSLNGNKVAVESEKKVDHDEVLARKSDNFGRGYQTNGNWRGGFGRGHRTNGKPGGGYERDRRYTRPQISDRMNSRECVKVWVKKEDKLDA